MAEMEPQIPISINALVRAFNFPRGSRESALGHGLEPPGEQGKDTAIRHHRGQKLLDWIQQKRNERFLY
jgi:hypothetical protein